MALEKKVSSYLEEKMRTDFLTQTPIFSAATFYDLPGNDSPIGEQGEATTEQGWNGNKQKGCYIGAFTLLEI